MIASLLPRGFIVAAQFLTRLPMPTLENYSPDDAAASTKWYPLIGLIIGIVIVLVHVGGQRYSPWLGPLGALLVWIWMTGALHLDGLADTADGLGAAHGDPTRFLEVTRDPRVGSFGVIALVAVLLSKLVLLASVPTPFAVVALIPAWARWGPLVWRHLVPPLGDGRGSDFSKTPDWTWPAISGVALGALSLWFAPALLVALLIVPAFVLYWRSRLGGMSGDCHGASIEVTEVGLLAAVVMFAA